MWSSDSVVPAVPVNLERSEGGLDARAQAAVVRLRLCLYLLITELAHCPPCLSTKRAHLERSIYASATEVIMSAAPGTTPTKTYEGRESGP